MQAVTFSSGSNNKAITSTDLYATCTQSFGGTSAAAPIASGIYALALEVNPCLTWRDVQHLTALTSVIINPSDPRWTANAAGLHVNEYYGFGMLDASAITTAASSWNSVASQLSFNVTSGLLATPVPCIEALVFDGGSPDRMVTLDRLEHVTVSVAMTTTSRGNLVVVLTCPYGTQSNLLTPRPTDTFSGAFEWSFTTVRCWGEPSSGTWSLDITSINGASTQSVLGTWTLTLMGTSTVTNYSSITTQQAAVPISPGSQSAAEVCMVCGPAAFRDARGRCWLCDVECAYGCLGAGPYGCKSRPPVVFFSGVPGYTGELAPDLQGM